MKKKFASWLWAIFFGGLFILSLDYWRWEEAVELGLGGFPSWMNWFVVLQLVLVAGIWAFVRWYWPDEKEEGQP